MSDSNSLTKSEFESTTESLSQKYGLIVTINKFNNCFESYQEIYTGNSMEDVNNKLINIISTEFNKINIDFPLELSDFEYIWFKQNYVKCDAFSYKIFYDGKWSEPWDNQEIYSDVLDKMLEKTIANPPDFSEMYGEPNPDEDKIDNFAEAPSEQLLEFEQRIKEIIEQSKDAHIGEDTVKECHCDKCKNRNV
jgi:hypothetical protein